jgi:hypothetical protein
MQKFLLDMARADDRCRKPAAAEYRRPAPHPGPVATERPS